MQHSKQPHAELLNTQLQSENNHKEDSSSELIEKEQITGTPFWIIGDKEKGYFLAMANYKLCENQETKELVKKFVKQNMWIIIIQVVSIVCTQISNTTIKSTEREEVTKEKVIDKTNEIKKAINNNSL